MILISPSTLLVSSSTIYSIAIPRPIAYLTGTGTAIEAHYIAIDFISSWTTNTDVVYSIDGVPSGSASHAPINQAEYLYNQTLFRISGLEDTKHILKVELRKPSVLLVSILYLTGLTSPPG